MSAHATTESNLQHANARELGATNGKRPRVIAVVRDYQSLHEGLRLRKNQLHVSCTTIDEIAGFTPGHASKLTAPKPLKKYGMLSFGLMLQTLGVELHMVEDPAAFKRVKARLVPREIDVPVRAYRWGKAGIASRRFVKRIAREGGFARARALTPAQRSASARMAAKARWSSAFAPPGIAARPDRGGDGAR